MPQSADALRHISGGRVLDIATGRGEFVHTLIGGLASFDEIVGIDSDPDLAERFADAFADRPDVRFVAMDAMQPDLSDASFDTVSISNSLHHFADPDGLLNRVRRLLRPGGHLIVSEMYRDGQAPAQLTHVQLHHWAAAIDRIEGIIHQHTFTRRQLVRLVDRLGLADLRVTDVVDDGDPRDHEMIAHIDQVIDRQRLRAAGHMKLESQGESIRRRLHRVGIQGATTLMVVGSTD
jgi:ubiquinone/menaquinone biosynthesis C-methylase UbiE